MRRIVTVMAAITAGALAAPWLAGSAGAASPPAPKLTSVSAHTSGPELEIDFVERNLVPGQNYAYVGSSPKATETIQCYRSSTFTPLPHTYKLSTTVTVPDTRGYTANANGVVKGFVFVENGIVLRDECTGTRPGGSPDPRDLRRLPAGRRVHGQLRPGAGAVLRSHRARLTTIVRRRATRRRGRERVTTPTCRGRERSVAGR